MTPTLTMFDFWPRFLTSSVRSANSRAVTFRDDAEAIRARRDMLRDVLSDTTCVVDSEYGMQAMMAIHPRDF